MKQIAATWFEAKIRYHKTTEDGTTKKITETYVFDALSFTEAEAKVVEEMSAYVSEEIEIKALTPASYSEVFFTDNNEGKWYKTKVAFVTIDEKSGKEKSQNILYLVQGDNATEACRNIATALSSVYDWRIKAISETTINDVITHANGSREKE